MNFSLTQKEFCLFVFAHFRQQLSDEPCDVIGIAYFSAENVYSHPHYWEKFEKNLQKKKIGTDLFLRLDDYSVALKLKC